MFQKMLEGEEGMEREDVHLVEMFLLEINLNQINPSKKMVQFTLKGNFIKFQKLSLFELFDIFLKHLINYFVTLRCSAKSEPTNAHAQITSADNLNMGNTSQVVGTTPSSSNVNSSSESSKPIKSVTTTSGISYASKLQPQPSTSIPAQVIPSAVQQPVTQSSMPTSQSSQVDSTQTTQSTSQPSKDSQTTPTPTSPTYSQSTNVGMLFLILFILILI